jgi:dTDP-4-amino-4,6-dideoxygalactose transaminase
MERPDDQLSPKRRVKFLDLARLHEPLRGRLMETIDDVIKSSDFILGSRVDAFESAFADAHEFLGCVGVGSGTEALWIALKAVGVGPGDEVIVPAFTFVATAEAVVLCGATPVLADVSNKTLLLDAECVDRVRTQATRAVVPVHLFGHAVDGGEIREWSRSGLKVVEDCAQAHLARSGGEPVGRHSIASAFSFYPGKNLGAMGDAGAVMTSDPDVLERVRYFRDHGSAVKYQHDFIGTTSRLDALQAAILSLKLEFLSDWTERRKLLANLYREELTKCEGVNLVPWEDGDVHHLMVVRVDAAERSAIRQRLAIRGIETGIHYPFALSQLASMQAWARSCPNAERAASEVISLPMDPMMTTTDVQQVCSAVGDSVKD